VKLLSQRGAREQREQDVGCSWTADSSGCWACCMRLVQAAAARGRGLRWEVALCLGATTRLQLMPESATLQPPQHAASARTTKARQQPCWPGAAPCCLAEKLPTVQYRNGRPLRDLLAHFNAGRTRVEVRTDRGQGQGFMQQLRITSSQRPARAARSLGAQTGCHPPPAEELQAVRLGRSSNLHLLSTTCATLEEGTPCQPRTNVSTGLAAMTELPCVHAHRSWLGTPPLYPTPAHTPAFLGAHAHT
jgi:hypothetical protein